MSQEGISSPQKERTIRKRRFNRSPPTEPEPVPLEEIGLTIEEKEPVPVSRERGYFHPQNLTSGYFWGLLIVVIVAALIFFILASQRLRDGTLQKLNKPLLPAFSTLFLFWVAFFILFFIAAYLSYVDSPLRTSRNLVLITVIITLLLLILAAIMFFQARNPQWGMFFLVLTFSAIIFWIMLVWNLHNILPIILSLLVVWLIYNSWILWEIFRRNDPSPSLIGTLF